MADAPKLSIVLMSGDIEKVHAGALMGSIAAASGMEVNVFATMEALKLFTKETVDKQDFRVGEIGMKLMEKNVDPYYKMIEDAKDLGDLKVYACSLVLDVMGWEKGDLLDVVDDIMGVTAFFGVAEGGQIMVL
ncbi:MAG TPA: DsrE/DsrF/DrsH-like family protein [Anaerolineae bacterium]|jgi:peroxiredoxin family protein|nr:DsrE/DsrF/DrsH-like family protein [Anaerolineae bacterium]